MKHDKIVLTNQMLGTLVLYRPPQHSVHKSCFHKQFPNILQCRPQPCPYKERFLPPVVWYHWYMYQSSTQEWVLGREGCVMNTCLANFTYLPYLCTSLQNHCSQYSCSIQEWLECNHNYNNLIADLLEYHSDQH